MVQSKGSFSYTPLPQELIEMGNELDELGGGDARVANCETFCRIYESEDENSILSVEDDSLFVLDPKAPPSTPFSKSVTRFKTNVLPPDQEGCYEILGLKLLKWLIDGFNSTLLTIGQTHTGKTHSIFGKGLGFAGYNEKTDNNQLGIFTRLLHDLFDFIYKHSNSNFVVGLSIFDLLGNELVDLLTEQSFNLNPASTDTIPTTTVHVNSFNMALKVVEMARSKSVNWTSGTPLGFADFLPNRAHSFVRLMLYNVNTQCVSTLHFVDLVGTNRRTANVLEPFPPTQEQERLVVSQQLSGFYRVIFELSKTSNSPIVISSRDSKLGQILGPLLTGNSKTFFLTTISDSSEDYAETINTLKISSKAQKISCGCVRVLNVNEKDLGLVSPDQILSVKYLWDEKKSSKTANPNKNKNLNNSNNNNSNNNSNQENRYSHEIENNEDNSSIFQDKEESYLQNTPLQISKSKLKESETEKIEIDKKQPKNGNSKNSQSHNNHTQTQTNSTTHIEITPSNKTTNTRFHNNANNNNNNNNNNPHTRLENTEYITTYAINSPQPSPTQKRKVSQEKGGVDQKTRNGKRKIPFEEITDKSNVIQETNTFQRDTLHLEPPTTQNIESPQKPRNETKEGYTSLKLRKQLKEMMSTLPPTDHIETPKTKKGVRFRDQVENSPKIHEQENTMEISELQVKKKIQPSTFDLHLAKDKQDKPDKSLSEQTPSIRQQMKNMLEHIEDSFGGNSETLKTSIYGNSVINHQNTKNIMNDLKKIVNGRYCEKVDNEVKPNVLKSSLSESLNTHSGDDEISSTDKLFQRAMQNSNLAKKNAWREYRLAKQHSLNTSLLGSLSPSLSSLPSKSPQMLKKMQESESNVAYAELSTQHDILLKKYDNLLTTLQREQKSNESYHHQILELEQEYDETTSNLNIKIDELTQKNKQLNSQLRKLQEGSEYSQIFEVYERDISRITKECERLRNENVSLFERIELLLQEVDPSSKFSISQISDISYTTPKKKSSLNENESQDSNLERKFLLQQKAFEESSKKIAKMARELKRKDEEHEQLGTELEKSRGEMKLMKSEIQERDKKNAVLGTHIQQLDEQLTTMRKELIGMKDQYLSMKKGEAIRNLSGSPSTTKYQKKIQILLPNDLMKLFTKLNSLGTMHPKYSDLIAKLKQEIEKCYIINTEHQKQLDLLMDVDLPRDDTYIKNMSIFQEALVSKTKKLDMMRKANKT